MSSTATRRHSRRYPPDAKPWIEGAASGRDKVQQQPSAQQVSPRMNGREGMGQGQRQRQRQPFQRRQEVEGRNSGHRLALQGAERHAKFLAGAADAEYRDCSCCGAERRAESHACKCTLGRLPRELMPNPSFKPSPNSVARRPSSAGPAANFALAVRRTTLSVPA